MRGARRLSYVRRAPRGRVSCSADHAGASSIRYFVATSRRDQRRLVPGVTMPATSARRRRPRCRSPIRDRPCRRLISRSDRREDHRVLTALMVLLRSIGLICGGHRANVLESLALRQQLAVLTRTVTRPRLRAADRLFWILLAKAWRDWRSALIVVQPDTVVRWHRQWLRRHWTRPSQRRRPGRRWRGGAAGDGSDKASSVNRDTTRPIPPIVFLLGSGLIGLGASVRRRRSRRT